MVVQLVHISLERTPSKALETTSLRTVSYISNATPVTLPRESHNLRTSPSPASHRTGQKVLPARTRTVEPLNSPGTQVKARVGRGHWTTTLGQTSFQWGEAGSVVRVISGQSRNHQENFQGNSDSLPRRLSYTSSSSIGALQQRQGIRSSASSSHATGISCHRGGVRPVVTLLLHQTGLSIRSSIWRSSPSS